LPYPQAPPAATAAEEEPLSMEKKPNEIEKTNQRYFHQL
jgi:hypothetical protein